MKKAILTALFGLLFALPAHGSVLGIGAGDLIKIKDDHDPATATDKVVYYLDRDWKRHPFPNLPVYYSWYHDFLAVKEISAEDMAQFRMGTPVAYRPGTRLIKIASIPKVYAVEPGGSLRWIESEAVAKSLYGSDWNKRVDDVAESYFASYHESAPLTVPAWPTGTVVRRMTDGAVFVIDGMAKRPMSLEVASSLRLYAKNFVETSDSLADYDESAPMTAADPLYVDTAQNALIETESRPAIDFPPSAQGIKPEKSSVLTTLRLTTGTPAIMRKLVVTISGLSSKSADQLTNVHVTDADGNDLFGIQQLPADAGDSVTLTFTGAHNFARNSVNLIQVRADVSGIIPSGTAYRFSIPRYGITLIDGGNGTTPLRFWYPTVTPSVAK